MSVLIKDMEIPECCGLCKLKTVVGLDKEKCLVSGVEFYSWDAGWGDEQRRHESCPLVPIPPHGRLIDADTLTISMAVPLDGKPYRYVHIDNIKNTPTIIPTEEGE